MKAPRAPSTEPPTHLQAHRLQQGSGGHGLVYLLCAPDGLPVGFELAAANAPERLVAAEPLERVLEPGQIVIGDKGFAGAAFEQHVRALGGTLLRPDRKDEQAQFGHARRLAAMDRVELRHAQDQPSLERHGGRTLAGLVSRIARRLFALSAAIVHNSLCGNPGRRLTACDR